jgi:nucleoside triphosphate pyrophosphatase
MPDPPRSAPSALALPCGWRLVLASASPRRKDLLASAGFKFDVRPASVPEEPRPGEAPRDYVVRLARDKATAVPASDREIVLAADTTVVAGGQILEKPRDAADARRMLGLLSGAAHEVITGICLRAGGRERVAAESTTVHFGALTPDEIAAYVETGEPMDKAGAYGIQGMGAALVEAIEGDYYTVVGFPVALFVDLLARKGWRYAYGTIEPMQ